MKEKVPVGSWLIAIIVVAAVLATGIYFFRAATQPGDNAMATSGIAMPATVAGASTVASTAIAHPNTDAQAPADASTALLPSLEDSDGATMDALSVLAGGDDLRALLIPTQIIPHLVATVDALPRQSIGRSILPMHTPRGKFVSDSANGQSTIGERNADRYAPYMAIVEQANPQAFVAWYKRNYPLFQQAYRELGYPRGYFNDRLIVAIDDILQAPDLQNPVAVIYTGTHYNFADPHMQSLSVGQKLMLRLGATNEAKTKAKLREIRALLLRRNGAAPSAR